MTAHPCGRIRAETAHIPGREQTAGSRCFSSLRGMPVRRGDPAVRTRDGDLSGQGLAALAAAFALPPGGGVSCTSELPPLVFSSRLIE